MDTVLYGHRCRYNCDHDHIVSMACKPGALFVMGKHPTSAVAGLYQLLHVLLEVTTPIQFWGHPRYGEAYISCQKVQGMFWIQ